MGQDNKIFCQQNLTFFSLVTEKCAPSRWNLQDFDQCNFFPLKRDNKLDFRPSYLIEYSITKLKIVQNVTVARSGPNCDYRARFSPKWDQSRSWSLMGPVPELAQKESKAGSGFKNGTGAGSASKWDGIRKIATREQGPIELSFIGSRVCWSTLQHCYLAYLKVFGKGGLC